MIRLTGIVFVALALLVVGCGGELKYAQPTGTGVKEKGFITKGGVEAKGVSPVAKD